MIFPFFKNVFIILSLFYHYSSKGVGETEETGRALRFVAAGQKKRGGTRKRSGSCLSRSL
jgi:hypothetical protein